MFPTVCGDFAFYQFPSPEYWARLFGETPESLSFALKVPEDVTAPVWPKHARYGVRAGEPNRGFLRSLAVLSRAAGLIGESDEERRCADFLRDSSTTGARALGL